MNMVCPVTAFRTELERSGTIREKTTKTSFYKHSKYIIHAVVLVPSIHPNMCHSPLVLATRRKYIVTCTWHWSAWRVALGCWPAPSWRRRRWVETHKRKSRIDEAPMMTSLATPPYCPAAVPMTSLRWTLFFGECLLWRGAFRRGSVTMTSSTWSFFYQFLLW